VSTFTGAPQVFPESLDAAMRSTALLSGRRLHHTARNRFESPAIRTDAGQTPGKVGSGAVDES
jgi:hypothetical protein